MQFECDVDDDTDYHNSQLVMVLVEEQTVDIALDFQGMMALKLH